MSTTALWVTGLLAMGGGAALCMGRLWRLQRKHAALETFSQKLLASQEEERKRIAAELHGSVGQNLLIIKNRAELGLAFGGEPAAIGGQLRQISALCSEALEQTRRIAHNLGPRHLDQLGLTEALDAMIDRIAASTQMRIGRRLEPVDDVFDREAATNLYRIAQEALNNVMKHARASSAEIQLLRDLDNVQFIVHDNGCGFEPARRNGSRKNGGLGLAEIGERTRILKGKLQIESQRGSGTRLIVRVPFHHGPESERV